MVGKMIGIGNGGPLRNVELRISEGSLFSAISKPAGEIAPGDVTAYRVERRRRWFQDCLHLILEQDGARIREVDFYRTHEPSDMIALLTELIRTIGERTRNGVDLYPPRQMPVFHEFQIEDLPELEFSGNSEEGWTALLPPEAPTFFSKAISVHLSATVETGLPWEGDTPLLKAILADLPTIVSRAESAFAEYAGDHFANDVKSIRDPRITFSDDGIEGEWMLYVYREDWADFVWWITFNGSEVQDIMAGD